MKGTVIGVLGLVAVGLAQLLFAWATSRAARRKSRPSDEVIDQMRNVIPLRRPADREPLGL